VGTAAQVARRGGSKKSSSDSTCHDTPLAYIFKSLNKEKNSVLDYSD
jgi:hypothetical protein